MPLTEKSIEEKRIDAIEDQPTGEVVDAYALPWPEIEKKARQNAVVLITCGALEKHGPHLPAGTDTIQQFPIAREICRRLQRSGLPAIVGMHIPFGVAEMPDELIPGVMVSHITLLNVIEDILKGFHRHGFRRFAIFAGHWGSIDICSAASRKFASETGASILLVTGASAESDFFEKHSKSRWDVPGDEWHSGESETSRMLYLFPELCQMEKASAERAEDMRRIFKSGDHLEIAPLFFSQEFDLRTDGFYGDAAAATSETGEYLIETSINGVVKQILSVFSSNG